METQAPQIYYSGEWRVFQFKTSDESKNRCSPDLMKVKRISKSVINEEMMTCIDCWSVSPIAHNGPSHPTAQRHSKLLMRSTQIPPLVHGLLAHSLMSDSRGGKGGKMSVSNNQQLSICYIYNNLTTLYNSYFHLDLSYWTLFRSMLVNVLTKWNKAQGSYHSTQWMLTVIDSCLMIYSVS